VERLTDILVRIEGDERVVALARALGEGRRAVATGAVGSSPVFCAAALARRTGRPVVMVVAHLDDADEALDECRGLGLPAWRLPALEALPGESGVSLDLFAERLGVVRDVLALGDGPGLVIAPIQALMQGVPAPAKLESLVRTIRKGEEHDLAGLIRWLDGAGYRRVEAVEEPGDFAVRGGILDVFAPGTSDELADPAGPVLTGAAVRLDFFGDTIDQCREIDLETMGSDRSVGGVRLVCVDVKAAGAEDGAVNFLELLPRRCVGVLVETMEVVEQGRGYFERLIDSQGMFGPPAVLRILEQRFHALAELNQFSGGATSAEERVELAVAALPTFSRDAQQAVGELAQMALEGRGAVIVSCQKEAEAQRLGELVAEFGGGAQGRIGSLVGYVHRGFAWDEGGSGGFTLVPYHELLGRFTTRRRQGRIQSGRAMDTFLDLQVGDYVVHQDHGIARFSGLTQMKPRELPGASRTQLLSEKKPAPDRKSGEQRAGELEEFLTLEFAGRSRLHVPVTQIDKVQKYVGGFGGKPPLSMLGGERWKNQKQRVAESVKDLAAEMLRVRAAREHMPGVQYAGDTAWQKEFEAEFPYTETEDQLTALGAIKKDMQSPRPMDRLICGDVGFGKTELAIRAAFKACEFGKQVAVLVPTTVLAEQHERTFRSRFAGYPFRIESISRLKSGKEADETLDALRKGHVDVIIGTHRLLSQDVRFNDLGLVIVDEEQRFGVEHKEKLLQLRLTVDVLTLSATPIPRTLHMSLLGLRDISNLTTPPLDRRAIVTEVIPFNPVRVKQAIVRELAREGQVFFVHNRVHDIKSAADDVQRLVPDARIVIGHGQMNPHELEDVMLKFVRRQADILVSTTIIESGIDIATANTIIIDNADRFGLSELHQLRGRVGRSKHRAYCYLLLDPERAVKDVALKRLKAIEQYSMLGAGFKIAMRDLEIRGAGNLLGAEQSGHIAAVGYEMYCRLLEDAVHTLKHERPPEPPSNTSIEIGIAGIIPRTYIASDQRRLEAYRRLATAASAEELGKVRTDLTEAYGSPPKPVERLLDLAGVRVAASKLGIKTITIREKDVIFRCERGDVVAAKLKTPAGPAPAPAAATSVDMPYSQRRKLAQAAAAAPKETALHVVALPPKTPGDLAEVYFRPPEAYLEPETLLNVLRKRLVG
jgi:transcription-repair coupling factor (superfamily II helicase)